MALLCLAAACDGGGKPGGRPAAQARRAEPPKDRAQADAEMLGRELLDIMDRVMSYRSAHRGRLPGSLRQAGIDSLMPQMVRRFSAAGSEPVVTIAFRDLEGHEVKSCRGTSRVLEDQMLHSEGFQVTCILVAGGERVFTVPPNIVTN